MKMIGRRPPSEFIVTLRLAFQQWIMLTRLLGTDEVRPWLASSRGLTLCLARLQKLREQLDGGPARTHPRPGRKLARRWLLTVSWRSGMILERQDLLRLRREGLRLPGRRRTQQWPGEHNRRPAGKTPLQRDRAVSQIIL